MKKLAIVMCVLVTASICNADLVINSGFEDGDNLIKIPDTAGEWAGLDLTDVVGPENDIMPFEGSHMLKFIDTGNNLSDITCDIHLLVDLTPYKDIISTGNAIIYAVAWFNRVNLDDQSDTGFGMNLNVFEGEVSSWNDQRLNGTRVKGMTTEKSFDTSKMSWEAAGIQFTIPTNVDFAEIGLYAFENVYNDLNRYEEFDGHYADNVSLYIVPEPATLLLIGFGTLALRKRR